MKKIGFILLLFIGFNLILLSPLIFLGIFSAINEHREANSEEIREKKAEEYLEQVSDMLERDFNVIIDRNLYKAEYKYIQGGYFFTTPDSYVMKKTKNILYKSKYFYSNKEKDKEVLIIDHMNDNYLLNKEKESYYENNRLSLFLAIINRFEFGEYILNDLLYDKSRRNNFYEIEKIFDKYRKGIIYRKAYYSLNSISDYLGELEYTDEKGYRHQNIEIGFLFYNKILDFKDIDEKDTFLKKYGERLRSYFNKKRKFEEIDWYEFMKYNHLKPRITFIFENATEDELKKLRKLIKPYYNEEDISIILETNLKETNENEIFL